MGPEVFPWIKGLRPVVPRTLELALKDKRSVDTPVNWCVSRDGVWAFPLKEFKVLFRNRRTPSTLGLRIEPQDTFLGGTDTESLKNRVLSLPLTV